MTDDWDAYQRVGSTWVVMDRWRARLTEPFVPSPGSELALDDEDWPPMPVSQVAWQGLGSAAMHLHGLRLHLDVTPPQKPELVPFAQLSLARGALVGAAQAVWVLSPPDRGTRTARARTATRYFMDGHRKFLAHLQTLTEQRHASTGSVAEHTKLRLDELDALRARDGQKAGMDTTGMVRDAAAAVFDDPVTQGDVLAMWRLGSSAAHGLAWSMFGGAGARESTPEELATRPADATLVVHRGGGDMGRLANAYLAAFHLTQSAWDTLAVRSAANGTAT